MKFLKTVFFFLCFFATIGAFAQSSSDLKKKRDKLNEELDQLNHEFQETTQNKKATLKQLNILKAQINVRTEKINTINSEMRLLDNQISENNNTVHNLQKQLTQLKKEYAAMILFAYHNQSAYNKLMFIFASNNFNQAYKRLTYLQQFGSYRQRQAESIQGTEKDLHVKINELDQTKKQKSNLLSDQETEKATLGKEKNDQVEVVSNLSKQEGQLKQQQRDLQAQKAKVDRELNAAIRREIEEARRRAEEEARAAERAAAAKAKAESREAPAPVVRKITKASTNSEVLNATPEAAKLSNDFLGNKGRLPWPVANGIPAQGFGSYTTGAGIRSDNSGVDIKTNQGANVRAVFSGEITNVNNIGGTYMVIIRHGEYFTAYENLRSVTVEKGQKVTTKQVLGVAATDSNGETLITFDLYKGTTAVNPMSWLAPN